MLKKVQLHRLRAAVCLVYVVVNLPTRFPRFAHLALEVPADSCLYCTVCGTLQATGNVTACCIFCCVQAADHAHTVQYTPLSAGVCDAGEHSMEVQAADEPLLMLSPFQSVVYYMLTVELLQQAQDA